MGNIEVIGDHQPVSNIFQKHQPNNSPRVSTHEFLSQSVDIIFQIESEFRTCQELAKNFRIQPPT
jgi:hypothetical protein